MQPGSAIGMPGVACFAGATGRHHESIAMHPLHRFALVALLGIVTALPALAQDTKGATARQLSRAVIAGVGVGVDKADMEGTLDPRVAACLRAIDPMAMEPAYQRLLTAKFTEDELAFLDAHYGSPLGELDWRSSLDTLRENAGVPVTDPVTVTPEQRKAINDFLRAPATRRLNLIGTDQDAESKQLLEAEIAKVLEVCR